MHNPTSNLPKKEKKNNRLKNKKVTDLAKGVYGILENSAWERFLINCGDQKRGIVGEYWDITVMSKFESLGKDCRKKKSQVWMVGVS